MARRRRRTIARKPAGFRDVLGDRAARVPVTSIKSMIVGHLGAAPALEIAVTTRPSPEASSSPTIHHTEIDSSAPWTSSPTPHARARAARCARSTPLAFGGNDGKGDHEDPRLRYAEGQRRA